MPPAARPAIGAALVAIRRAAQLAVPAPSQPAVRARRAQRTLHSARGGRWNKAIVFQCQADRASASHSLRSRDRGHPPLLGSRQLLWRAVFGRSRADSYRESCAVACDPPLRLPSHSSACVSRLQQNIPAAIPARSGARPCTCRSCTPPRRPRRRRCGSPGRAG